jgi:hypothetical protein
MNVRLSHHDVNGIYIRLLHVIDLMFNVDSIYMQLLHANKRYFQYGLHVRCGFHGHATAIVKRTDFL